MVTILGNRRTSNVFRGIIVEISRAKLANNHLKLFRRKIVGRKNFLLSSESDEYILCNDKMSVAASNLICICPLALTLTNSWSLFLSSRAIRNSTVRSNFRYAMVPVFTKLSIDNTLIEKL